MKENLSFLQKERLAKEEFIKSLLETQTDILNYQPQIEARVLVINTQL